MLKNLKLTKPLTFIDIETTVTRPNLNRIVELCIVKIFPNGDRECQSRRVNPQVPIPAEAIKVHAITDADVADKPIFRQYAKSVKEFLEDCDLAGFNLIRFDLPLLEAEFERAGVKFSRQNRQLVDSLVLYHLMEPRDLNAVYEKYCGKKLAELHTAKDAIIQASSPLTAFEERGLTDYLNQIGDEVAPISVEEIFN